MAAVSSLATLTTAGGRNHNVFPSSNKTPTLSFTPKTTAVMKSAHVSCKRRPLYPTENMAAGGGDAGIEPFYPDFFGKAAAGDAGHDDEKSDGHMIFPFFVTYGKDAEGGGHDDEKSDGHVAPFYVTYGKDAEGGGRKEAEGDDMLMPFYWIFGKQQQNAAGGGRQEMADDMMMPFYWIFGKEGSQEAADSDDMLNPFFFWIFGKQQGDNDDKGDAGIMFGPDLFGKAATGDESLLPAEAKLKN